MSTVLGLGTSVFFGNTVRASTVLLADIIAPITPGGKIEIIGGVCATALATTGGPVDVSNSAPPTAGQVLKALGPALAQWQDHTLENALSQGNTTGANNIELDNPAFGITSSDGTAGPGAPLNITAGVGDTGFDGGDINLTAGNGVGAGNGGDIVLTPGMGTLSGEARVDGDLNVTGKLTVAGLIDPTGVVFDEQAATPSVPTAGKGTIWVRDDSPNVAVFTDDTGADFVLGGAVATPDLNAVLTAGNTTGGVDIVVSSGDSLVLDDPTATITSTPGTVNDPGTVLNIAPGSGSGTGAGGDLAMFGGTGGTNGDGGNVGMTGGVAGPGGNGGNVSVSGGTGGVNGDGGMVTIVSGVNGGTGSVGDVRILTENAASTGDAGNIEITGGSTAGGSAASVTVTGGLSAATGNDGGGVFLTGGNHTAGGLVTDKGGDVLVEGGSGSAGDASGGNVSLLSGAPNGDGEPGDISITTTSGATGAVDGGDITVLTGNAGGGGGRGGDLNVTTGDGVGAGDGGDINIILGTAPGAGTDGKVNVTGDVDISGKLTVGGLIDPTGLVLDEQAAVPSVTVAGKGTVWVRDDTPNVLVFTDDAGADTVLTAMGPTPPLSDVLIAGNTTGANDIVVSSGQKITTPGAADDLTLEGRGNSITLNESGDLALDASFTATSLVGALNEVGLGANVYHVSTTAELLAAIAALVSGGKIVMAPGTYDIDATISSITANTVIEGCGKNETILRRVDPLAADMISTTNNNITLRGLQLNGNDGVVTSDAHRLMLVDSQSNFCLDDCRVTNFSNGSSVTAVQFNNVNASIVSKCVFDDTTGATNLTFTNTVNGSRVINCSFSGNNAGNNLLTMAGKMSVVGCSFLSGSGRGINVTNAGSITGCTFEDVVQNPILSTGSSNVRIGNCTFDDCGPISLGGDCYISNCDIRSQNGQDCIDLSGSGNGVVNNTFMIPSGQNGIDVAANASNGYIAGNTMQGTASITTMNISTTGNEDFLVAENNSRTTYINDGTIHGYDSFVIIGDSDPNSHNFTLSDIERGSACHCVLFKVDSSNGSTNEITPTSAGIVENTGASYSSFEFNGTTDRAVLKWTGEAWNIVSTSGGTIINP